MPSRATLERWSRHAALVALAEAMDALAFDRSVKVGGLLEVHDGDCSWPEAPCDCDGPLYLPRAP